MCPPKKNKKKEVTELVHEIIIGNRPIKQLWVDGIIYDFFQSCGAFIRYCRTMHIEPVYNPFLN